MQSYLQYRRFGRQIEAQLKRDREKAAAKSQGASDRRRTQSADSSDQTVVEGSDRDPEKGEETPLEQGGNKRNSGDRRSQNSGSQYEEREPNTTENVNNENTNDQRDLQRERSQGTNLGRVLTGVNVRDRTEEEGGDQDRQVFVVGYEGDQDKMNPHNWSRTTRFVVTMQLAAIGAVVGIASSIDSEALQRAATEFHVAEVVESMATGMFGCEQGWACS